MKLNPTREHVAEAFAIPQTRRMPQRRETLRTIDASFERNVSVKSKRQQSF